MKRGSSTGTGRSTENSESTSWRPPTLTKSEHLGGAEPENVVGLSDPEEQVHLKHTPNPCCDGWSQRFVFGGVPWHYW